MKAFTKSIDEGAWRAILTGWTTLTETLDAWVREKSELTQTADEDRDSNFNSKPSYVIFSGVYVT